MNKLKAALASLVAMLALSAFTLHTVKADLFWLHVLACLLGGSLALWGIRLQLSLANILFGLLLIGYPLVLLPVWPAVISPTALHLLCGSLVLNRLDQLSSSAHIQSKRAVFFSKR